MLTLIIQEMSKEYPTLMDTLVHERDQLVHFPLCRGKPIAFFLFQCVFLIQIGRSLGAIYS